MNLSYSLMSEAGTSITWPPQSSNLNQAVYKGGASKAKTVQNIPETASLLVASRERGAGCKKKENQESPRVMFSHVGLVCMQHFCQHVIIQLFIQYTPMVNGELPVNLMHM